MLPMAGGMDLLGMMKDYIVSPERVVSIKGLDQTICGRPTADCESAPRRRSSISPSTRRRASSSRRW